MRFIFGVIAIFFFSIGGVQAEPIPILGYNVNMTLEEIKKKATAEEFLCIDEANTCQKFNAEGGMDKIQYKNFFNPSNSEFSIHFLFFTCGNIGACGVNYQPVASSMQDKFKVKFDISQELQPEGRPRLKSLNLMCAKGKDGDLLCLALNKDLNVVGVLLDRFKMGKEKKELKF